MRSVGIIPARWKSSRFPGKSLCLISGKPMLQRVIEQSEKTKTLDKIIVATDDLRIFDFVNSLNKQNVCPMMTKKNDATGTDRIAEIAEKLNVENIINIQGDEPIIDPNLIDKINLTLNNKEWDMSSAATLIEDQSEINNKSVVKVVFNQNCKALYFSRLPIPFNRDDKNLKPCYWKHIGIYGYKKKFLLKMSSSPPSILEEYEKLEQLRALHLGANLCIIKTEHHSIGVDTPDDVTKVEMIIKESTNYD